MRQDQYLTVLLNQTKEDEVSEPHFSCNDDTEAAWAQARFVIFSSQDTEEEARELNEQPCSGHNFKIQLVSQHF